MKPTAKKPDIKNSRKKKKRLNANQPKEKKKRKVYYEKSCVDCGRRVKTSADYKKPVKCSICRRKK